MVMIGQFLASSLVYTLILILFEICQHIRGYVAHPPGMGALWTRGDAVRAENTL